MLKKTCCALALLGLGAMTSGAALACTMQAPSPEIEIEYNFEDYDIARDRVIYKLEIEIEVLPPTGSTQCQCGIGVGSTNQQLPDSFAVVDAAVAIKHDDGTDAVLKFFGGFDADSAVADALSNLPGFGAGATAFGLSTAVDPFNLPPLLPDDRLVLGFIIEFAPADFDQVNGNFIRFAAGSTEPGHPLTFLMNYQPVLNLPPYQLTACDVTFDNLCNVSDINAILSLGPINVGVPRTDPLEIYDLIGDDVIDRRDIVEWLAVAGNYNGLSAPYKHGDANLDGLVNQTDLIRWFNNRGTSTLLWSKGNFDGDGFVGTRDFIIWRANRTP